MATGGSLTYDSLQYSQPKYILELSIVQPPRSTRFSFCLTLSGHYSPRVLQPNYITHCTLALERTSSEFRMFLDCSPIPPLQMHSCHSILLLGWHLKILACSYQRCMFRFSSQNVGYLWRLNLKSNSKCICFQRPFG